MGFPDLKSFLRAKHPGVDNERIAMRTQGCWNCVHWDHQKALDIWWSEARAHYLQRGMTLTLISPKGENDQRVVNIRKMIPMVDAAMQTDWGCCRLRNATFQHATFLCDKWTGKQGASVAREGAGPDKLPQELQERLHEKKVE